MRDHLDKANAPLGSVNDHLVDESSDLWSGDDPLCT
jgi:hypothetical protein